MTTTTTAQWGKHTVNLEWVSATEPPAGLAVTSTHGFCFWLGHVILVRIDHRGWDIPGGHVEGEETAEEAFIREAIEEANIEGSSQMIGYIEVDNSVDEFWEQEKYPAKSCQVYFRMDVEHLGHFKGDFEALERTCYLPAEIPLHHQNWNELYDVILQTAIDAGPNNETKEH